MLVTETILRLSAVSKLTCEQKYHIFQQLADQTKYDDKKLCIIGMNALQIEQFHHLAAQHIKDTVRWLETSCLHNLIIYGSANYPPQLYHIPAPPWLLFVHGNIELLKKAQIALVGSRNYSHYGERWAHHFATHLANAGFIITSGLALGIDGICHHAAHQVQGKNIAVLGSGFHHCYPRQHRKLAEEIIVADGALVSEFLPNMPPQARHFPQRNRIISGLSLATLVIEASIKSGSLTTARHALDQGRDIFALPGPLDSANSSGTHWLIQQGAYLAITPNDIITHIMQSVHWCPATLDTRPPLKTNLSISQQSNKEKQCKRTCHPEVLAVIEYHTTSLDIIMERLGNTISDIMPKLLELELSGDIALTTGGYIKIK